MESGGSVKSRVTNCLIHVSKEQQSILDTDPTGVTEQGYPNALFWVNPENGSCFVNIDGYAIIPMEEYVIKLKTKKPWYKFWS